MYGPTSPVGNAATSEAVGTRARLDHTVVAAEILVPTALSPAL
jgi:hypothetical protein